MANLDEKVSNMAIEDEELDLSKEKKKKKKKEKKEEPSSSSADAAGADEVAAKPKSPPAAEGAAPAEMDEDEAAFLDSLKASKKTKKSGAKATGEAATEEGYTYQFLLLRVFDGIRAKHPELAGAKKKYTLKPPNVVRDGTKKSAFTNFSEICKSMGRAQEHLLAFVLAELGTSGAIDGNNCLILKGKFQAKHIEGLLRRYITEYVQCAMCHSLDTKLEKDQNSRLYQMNCNACGASRTVSAITGGFKAQIGKRKKM